MPISSKALTRIATACLICMMLSFMLALYLNDKRWMSIGYAAMAVAMWTFCAFVVGIIRGDSSIEGPRILAATTVIVIGIFGGLLVPLLTLYLLFR
jgi:hypothetical protein